MPKPKETVIRTADKLRKGDKIAGGSAKNIGQILRITSIKKNDNSYYITFSDGAWTSCGLKATFRVITR